MSTIANEHQPAAKQCVKMAATNSGDIADMSSQSIIPKSPQETESILNEIRCLAADLVQQFKGGHPGTPIGAASIGLALWGEAMTYNPKEPLWVNRDRFVLSAGHACLLQYIFLHLVGYEAWTMDMLKKYHSRDFKDSLAAGHPEIDPEAGIEVTTGPLGQGIANAVGLAIGAKQLAARYNRENISIVNNKIWCFTGDGCLQEGIGQEALSVAGHMGLDNLILIYDCNKITVDGSTNNCWSENTPEKLRATGWYVIEVSNGSTDVPAIAKAFTQAKQMKGKPICVLVNTVIGFGSRKANTGPVHGAALGDNEVEFLKSHFGHNPQQKFVLTDGVRQIFAPLQIKGANAQKQWNEHFEAYKQLYPELANEFERRLYAADTEGLLDGGLPKGWEELLPPKCDLPMNDIPTRKASGIAVEALCSKYPDFMVGSADLLESTFVSWKGMVEFQNPLSGMGDYSGRQIRYGIREHAMVGIANGLAAYQKQAFIPVFSTFFMFYIYAAPAVRMAALQKLKIIGIATHDSIGIGEDGPTHQPIALASFFRALPNLQIFRPADAEETLGAWCLALRVKSTPTILALSRQPVPLLKNSDRHKVSMGAYTVFETVPTAPRLTLVATGTEVALAIEAAKGLANALNGAAIRVVSMPIMSLFDAQPVEYRQSVIPSTSSLTVAIEAWASLPWARYVGASLSMHTFGHSGPQADLFEMYGFGIENVVRVIGEYVRTRTISEDNILIPKVGEFEELLLGTHH